MINIFLVRHGQASAGTDNYDRLSVKGIEQSEMLGAYWNNHGLQFDAAFSGSLERQRHTAKLALAQSNNSVEVKVLEGLNEYDHDTVDRLHGQGVHTDIGMSLQFHQYVDVMSRWRDSTDTSEYMSWDAFSEQGWNTMHAALNEFTRTNAVQNDNKKEVNLVFFTSGGVVTTIFTKLMSSTFDTSMRSLWQLRNSSVTRLLLNQDGLSLVSYNTVPHLQQQDRPELITQI